MSENSQSSNKRIAKNTLMLYFRMLFIMVISLFTSRVFLQQLGAQDFGIYNVVGGVVAMFSVFSNSLASAISRFITYELAKNDNIRLRRIFSTSVTIQIGLAIGIIVLAEIGGLWFLNYKMNIPLDRMYAANWVFQLSILSFAVGLISVPYNAMIIANEKMAAFAYISIFEVIMKLLICYCLIITPIDKLISYSILLFLLSVGLRLMYGIYCKRHFQACSYSFFIDKQIIKEIAGFAGWSSFTLVAYTLYNSGLNILLNLFFGPILNAARGIASQVQNAVQGFSKNFEIALNPQIIKNYAEKNYERMYSLIFKGTKFSFFLMFFLTLPLMIELDVVLSVWLGKIPDHTINLVRLILILINIDTLGGPLYTAQQATGKIKEFQLITGTLMLMILPVSYLCLKLKGFPECVFVVYIIILSVVQVISAIMVCKSIGMSLASYIKEVYCKIIVVVCLSIPFPLIVYYILPHPSTVGFFMVCLVSVLSVGASIFFAGFSFNERVLVSNKIHKILMIKNKDL